LNRIDQELIVGKLSLMRENVEHLRKLAGLQKERFMQDPILRAAAERLLHISIETVIDIGNHIISAKRLRKPERYTDIPLILKEARILNPETADKILNMVKFRHILVHLYTRVDVEKVYETLRNNLNDFHQFESEIIQYLKTLASASQRPSNKK